MTASARSSAVVAVLVALVAFVAVAVTMGDIGLTWDEPAYMGSAQAYGEWLTVVGQSVARLDLAKPFSEPALRAYWQHDSTDQHPPVGKYAPAISWRLLRGLVGDITALRLGNAAIFAALAALVYLLAASLAGMAGGLFAAASLVLMPRLFFHGHLTTLDIPVAFFWTLTVWLFWRWTSVVHEGRPSVPHEGRQPAPRSAAGPALGTACSLQQRAAREADGRRRLWPAGLPALVRYQGPADWGGSLALGLCYGLALGTKNTSFFLPPILLLWALIFRRNRRTLALLIGMGVVAVPVFLLTWPALYSDLPGRLMDYLNRMTLGHWDIVQYYLGQSYARPPWHYPFVVALVTVPATVLAMALLGLLRVVRAGRTDAGGWLIIVNAFGPLCFFAFVSSQVYGSERLFLVVFPYLAILAGMGFAVVWRWAIGRPPQPPNPGGSALPSPSIGRGAGGEGVLAQGEGQGEGQPPHVAWRVVLASALAVLLLLPGALGIVAMHPHELSYFSGIIGGVEGAERLGLELTYWCETYRAALPFLNAVPEQSPSVWTEEEGVLYTYRQLGLLRADINVGGRVVKAGPLAATYALIQRRPSGYTPEIEALLRDRRPVFVVRQGDMPLAYVFRIGD